MQAHDGCKSKRIAQEATTGIRQEKAAPGPKTTIHILVSSQFSACEKSRNQRAEATPNTTIDHGQPKTHPNHHRVLRANSSRPPPSETARRGSLTSPPTETGNGYRSLPPRQPPSSLLGKTTTAAPGRNPTKRAVTTPFLVRCRLEEPLLPFSPRSIGRFHGAIRGADRSLPLILSRDWLVGFRFRAAGVTRIFRFLGSATCVCDAGRLPPGVPRRRRRHCRLARARPRGPRPRRRRGLHRRARLRQTQQFLIPPPPRAAPPPHRSEARRLLLRYTPD